LAVFFTPFSCLSAIIEMADVKEQRICVKFYLKLNKTAPQTRRMLKEAFGEQALSQARTFAWFKPFKNGRESVEGLLLRTGQNRNNLIFCFWYQTGSFGCNRK